MHVNKKTVQLKANLLKLFNFNRALDCLNRIDNGKKENNLQDEKSGKSLVFLIMNGNTLHLQVVLINQIKSTNAG